MIKILDIPITDLAEHEVLKLIAKHLFPFHKKLFIATPNPEIILASLKTPLLNEILKKETFNVPDGAGLLWANYYLQKTIGHSKLYKLLFFPISAIFFTFNKKVLPQNFNKVITGTDLMKQICLDPHLSKHRIYLLGGKPGTAETVKENFLSLNSKLNIVETSAKDPDDESSIEDINNSKAQILFVAYGGSPLKQEMWISNHLSQLKHIKIVIGVGGAFDYHANKIKRAPGFMRRIGLEWLVRLFTQPKRIKRIFNAVFIFTFKIIKFNLQNQNK